MKKYKNEILIAFIVYNLIGVIGGAMQAAIIRDGHIEWQPDHTYKKVEDGNGCIYKSIAAFMNPGHILGCELFRKRWEIGK